MSYKFLPHTADVKVQVIGKKITEVFSDSAMALKETICGEIKVASKIKKEINVNGKDLKSLLYNFLEEFLYLLDAEDFLLNKLENLKIDEKKFSLTATATGDSASNYEFTNDVKAITYSDMVFEKIKEEFRLQFVLDV